MTKDGGGTQIDAWEVDLGFSGVLASICRRRALGIPVWQKVFPSYKFIAFLAISLSRGVSTSGPN